MSKKVGIVAVLCLAVFSGFAAPLAGQLNVKSQSALYKQITTHIAWQVCSSAHFHAKLQLTFDRTLQLQQASQPEGSFLPPSLSNLAEAQSFSGH
jgi:hypothetical protein